MIMDFQSAMETFVEAWVATKSAPLTDLNPQSHAIALTRNCKTPPPVSTPAASHFSGRDSTDTVCTPVPPRSTNSLESVVSSPSAKEEFDHAKSGSGKSLPVHCIVESINVIEESKVSQPWRKRCLVETDSYVIIPVCTPFQGLVQAALLRLGYSAECATTAKGLVVIKNWKGLNFEQISDDPLITVGDILGELTAVATLRIQIIKNRNAAYGDIKDKLLHFFLTQSQGLLNSTGCPLDELLLSQICRSGSAPQHSDISDECRRKFDQWWKAQFSSQSPSNKSYSGVQFPNQYPANAHTQKPFDRNLIDPLHSVMQTVQNQFPTQKTRMRTSFDPELELPKLQRWFADNQHPSRQQIQQYVKELNSLESRRGRKPLDINNVVYWFKNARAAQKRAEIRSIGPGLNCHLPVNGFADHASTNGTNMLLGEPYLGHPRPDNSRNIPEYYRRAFQATTMSDELSNATSEMEEDDVSESQPQSPVAPLSLTKSCRNDYKGEDESSHPGNSPPAPDIQVQSEIKEEPVNLHSPQDQQSMSQKEATSDREDNGNGGDKSRIESQASERPLSQNYRRSPEYESQLPQRCNDSLERLTAGFPLVPNSMFSQSIMYMSHYIPGVSHPTPSPPSSSNVLGLTADERRKRNRTFIDPVTEVPRLEQWFSLNTHPSHNLILKYTEELNCMAYRQKFPRLEPKNVQFWFKNRRAKCKRLKMSLFDAQTSPAYHHGDRE